MENMLTPENITLPYSNDAEQAVLGAILKDPSCLPSVMDTLKIEHLYFPQHQSIYEVIMQIDAMGGRVDPLVVLDELKKRGVFDDVGGKTYLMKIADAVPSAHNVESYIKIVIDKFYLRTLILTANKILNKANGGTESADEILDIAEQEIYDIRQGRASTGPARIRDVIMNDVFHRLKILQNGTEKEKEQYQGIPTGFSHLDKVLGGGFHRSNLILIGARPGMGKTSFALNVARNIAMKGRKVLFFSLEMSNEELAQRIISTEARIVSQKLRTGDISDQDWVKLGMALSNLTNAPLYFDNSGGINVSEMKARVRRAKDVDCVIIDYLQLMSGSKKNDGNRVQEISEITRGLKLMAKDLKIPVVTCSQLSRNTAKTADHRPQLTDLRESGSIEQDADIVLMLHREGYYNNGNDESDDEKKAEAANIAEIIVAKNRHGETTKVEVAWNPEFTMFSTLERIKDDK